MEGLSKGTGRRICTDKFRKVYFSTYKKEWCSSQLDLTQIDLDALETDILVRLGITYDELSKMTEKKYHLLEKNA